MSGLGHLHGVLPACLFRPAVLFEESPQLTPISTASNAVLPSIKLPFLSEPEGSPITISPDSRSVYLSTESGVTAIDLATGMVSWTVKLGNTGPGASYQIVVSPDGRTIYTNGANENVYRIDAATGVQLPPIATGWYTTDFALGPHGELYYLGYRGTNIPVSGPWALARFDAATEAASPIIRLPMPTPLPTTICCSARHDGARIGSSALSRSRT
jgi:hypothetical protein